MAGVSVGRCWRLRDRVLVVSTAVMAWGLASASPWVIDASGILRANSSRFLMTRWLPGASPAYQPPVVPGRTSRENDAGGMTMAAFAKEQERQCGAVEVIVETWRRVMWYVSAFLAGMALLAGITGWARFFQLLAAAVILLSTAATLVAMRLLISPAYGGMEPLSIESYVIMGVGQSLMGWILLVAYWRRRPAVEARGR